MCSCIYLWLTLEPLGVSSRYRLQTVKSMNGVSLMLRLLWACLRWDDMAVKPSAAVGTTRTGTPSTVSNSKCSFSGRNGNKLLQKCNALIGAYSYSLGLSWSLCNKSYFHLIFLHFIHTCVTWLLSHANLSCQFMSGKASTTGMFPKFPTCSLVYAKKNWLNPFSLIFGHQCFYFGVRFLHLFGLSSSSPYQPSPIPTHCYRDIRYGNHHHRDHKASRCGTIRHPLRVLHTQNHLPPGSARNSKR